MAFFVIRTFIFQVIYGLDLIMKKVALNEHLPIDIELWNTLDSDAWESKKHSPPWLDKLTF